MNAKILLVNKTTSEWVSETTVIGKGLPCVEFTTDGRTLLKIGDGSNIYSKLPYISDGSFDIGNYPNKDEVTEQINTKFETLDTNKVDKEVGKGLFSGSYNDLTDKPVIPEAYDDTVLSGKVADIENIVDEHTEQLEEIISGGIGKITSETKPVEPGNIGDIVYCSNPTPGGYIGWVYTEYGWFSFGLIESVDGDEDVPENAMITSNGTVFRLVDGSPFLYANS